MFNQPMMSSMLDQNEMPYAYGLVNTNPLPMNPSPISALPPLYPSMMTPQLNPQAPFTNPNMVQARYAAGGSVYDEGGYGLTDMAEILREQGDREDTILAHINPEEAAELGEMYGYDINPMTGLPQFGKKKHGLNKLAHKIGHAARSVVRTPVARKVLPLVGAVVGNALMPGLGGVIGGAATKATIAKAQHKDPLKAALRGAALGAGLGYGLPLAGKGLSALGATNIGGGLQQLGAGQYMPGLSSIGKAFGFGAPAAATPSAVPQAAGLKGLAQQSALASFLGGAQQPSAPYGLSSLYSNVVPENAPPGATTGSLYPTLMNMVPGYKEKEGFGLGALSKDLGNMLLPAGIIGTLLRKEKIKHEKEPSYEEMVSHMQAPWRPDQYARPIQPFQRNVIQPTEEEIAGLEDITKPMRYPEFFRPYAHGGYIDGHSGGQDDTIPAMLSDGEFVISADVVSALGDGNNSAGARKLDAFMKNVRHHKGQESGLPPKAKSLSAYMRT